MYIEQNEPEELFSAKQRSASTVYPQKNPVYPKKSPVYPQKSPVYPKKGPVYSQKSPVYPQKRTNQKSNFRQSNAAHRLFRRTPIHCQNPCTWNFDACICIYVCKFMHIYIYVHIHVYISIHIHVSPYANILSKCVHLEFEARMYL